MVVRQENAALVRESRAADIVKTAAGAVRGRREEPARPAQGRNEWVAAVGDTHRGGDRAQVDDRSRGRRVSNRARIPRSHSASYSSADGARVAEAVAGWHIAQAAPTLKSRSPSSSE